MCSSPNQFTKSGNINTGFDQRRDWCCRIDDYLKSECDFYFCANRLTRITIEVGVSTTHR